MKLLEAQKDLAKYDNNLNTVSQQIPVTDSDVIYSSKGIPISPIMSPVKSAEELRRTLEKGKDKI